MAGSHGPSYYKDSPSEVKAFFPECRSADLGQCTKEEIRNAYDNSVRETDRVLAESIRVLREAEAAKGFATGLVWVSD
ncbi:membrane-associated, metal-dependent hydrolase, partial [gut metagenome]